MVAFTGYVALEKDGTLGRLFPGRRRFADRINRSEFNAQNMRVTSHRYQVDPHPGYHY